VSYLSAENSTYCTFWKSNISLLKSTITFVTGQKIVRKAKHNLGLNTVQCINNNRERKKKNLTEIIKSAKVSFQKSDELCIKL